MARNWLGSNLRLQILRLGAASLISTETPSPEDQGLNVVQRSEPHSRVIHSDSIQAEPQTSSEVLDDESSPARYLLITLLCLLGFAIFAAGGIYWYQARHFPVVVAISPPDGRDKDPLGKQSKLVPVSPDLLHVTSIALGNPRLTIVNGRRLAEEDWLVIKTPNGEASVRVISIEDGLVKFKHGGETIGARLQTPPSPPPH